MPLSLVVEKEKQNERRLLMKILGSEKGVKYLPPKILDNLENALFGEKCFKDYRFSISIHRLSNEEKKALQEHNIIPYKTISFRPIGFSVSKPSSNEDVKIIKDDSYSGLMQLKYNGDKSLLLKVFYEPLR